MFRRERGQGNITINFPCSADHDQDWQPYPVDPHSAICDDMTTYLSPGCDKCVGGPRFIIPGRCKSPGCPGR